MQGLLVTKGIIAGLLLCSTGFAKSPESATFGFIPAEKTDVLHKSAVELAKALQERLQVPINVYISKDYSGLVDAMKDKKIDFAFFTALTFVDAERRAGAKVLMRKVWEKPVYYSSIITRKDTKITSIEQLRGKRIAVVDERSTSGYLFPMAMLKKRKLEPGKFFGQIKFYGQHENAVRALLAGEADAAAVYSDHVRGKTGAWSRNFPEDAEKIRVLWVSPQMIPGDPFCVRQDFYDSYPQFTYEMMLALSSFKDEPPEKNILKKLFEISSMEFATSKLYDGVRELDTYLHSN